MVDFVMLFRVGSILSAQFTSMDFGYVGRKGGRGYIYFLHILHTL
jgi:hypothetical protein